MLLETAVSNFLDALTSGARSAACTLLGLPQYLNDMTTRLSGGTFTPFLGGIPNLWRRALCDTDAPPPNPPPFIGGQCSALYTITGSAFVYPNTQCVGNDSPFNFGNYWGPIESARIVLQTTVPQGRVFDLEFVNYGNRSFPMSIPQTTRIQVGTSSTNCPDVSLTSFTPQRVDGQPDNCGNPPPDYDPPTPEDVEIPRDITYENSDGISVTIPVVFVFARAQLTVDADVVIPFTVNISPTLNITGNLNVDGTVNFNLGGGNATSLPKDPRKGDCDDIALPDGEVPDDPTDSDQPDEPERDRSQVITGVLVTVNQISSTRQTVIAQDENPDIFAPSLGHVNFLVRVGRLSAGWTPDLPVKNRRCLIQCPWTGGAVDVKGTPQPGVTWTLTPVFGYAGIPVEYIQ